LDVESIKYTQKGGQEEKREGKTKSDNKRVKGESFEKCSILFKVKKDENFNHRNIWNISRIKI